VVLSRGRKRYNVRMRTPQEAVSIILAQVRPGHDTESCPLASAANRVLGEDVAADIDLPPFRKTAMDGFAVRCADFSGLPEGGAARLRALGEARAGEPWTRPVEPGECVAIYTGGAVPDDCDGVVVVEKSRREGEDVLLADRPVPGQHICDRGEDLRAGEVVLTRGTRLGPAALSVLAAVGCEPVPVFLRPRVAILTTGDELVSPTEKPGPGQIREGNILHLAAMTRAAGADVVRAGIVCDEPGELAEAFRSALDECDLLVTTGGVSMGQYDLVGKALEASGVTRVFHKVAIKPGKPVWFGTAGDRLVLGLPGNPVSCLVGHEVFVRPALAKLAGLDEEDWHRPKRVGCWVGPPNKKNDRQQNVPVQVAQNAEGLDEIEPVAWRGSADIVGLTRAVGLAVIPPGVVLEKGEPAQFWLLD